ncbi:MAG: hypothetical protein KKC68_05560 [Candidatus Thermoplasmatota archaeon]|nr:hypothetical protein [Candidatus Thermoplasmatota archaeon]MBU1941222.1 hypothetical protein [Candidatus Thermoplasmatota archaeon]
MLFRIFLGVDFHQDEIYFSLVCIAVFTLNYLLAYVFARYKATKINLPTTEKSIFIKTVLTNQGRSSAFIGGSMLAIAKWSIYAAIYMSVGAIFLFALIPYMLAYLHKKEPTPVNQDSTKIKALPWYLRLFPWYLIVFALVAIILHGTTHLNHTDFGDYGILFDFFTSLTIPAALYYVGAGIHPNDLKLNEMKRIFTFKINNKNFTNWTSIRAIIFLTVVLIPLIITLIFGSLLAFSLISAAWFSVIVINSILPITSTNMFLIPYGIDKKITALAVTWTTIVCVPIVVFLIFVFSQYL